MKIIWTTFVALTLAATAVSDELPRKTKSPRESYPNVDVIYDSVTSPDGKRLRTIITKPRNAKGKLPVIFVAGWLSCDSVEAPAGTKDASGLVFQGLARLPQFSLFRVDKQGVGDSEGVCAETDFESELGGYRAAFRALKNYDFIDSNRVFILGISNGGGFAPLVPESQAEQQQVRGYISVGGWAKTWFEHMLEIERRRFTLIGKTPAEVTEMMKRAATLYYEWLIKDRPVGDILKEQPQSGGSLARRKRSRAFVWTSARVLSAVTKIESRRRVVARNGAHLCVAWRVRLDHEPRRSPIDRRVCFGKRWRRVSVRGAQDGSHISALFEYGRRFQR